MKGSGSGAFKTVCVLFSAAALILSLLGSVRAAGLSRQIEVLEAAVAQAEEENRRLRLRADTAMGLEELERYAVEVLGMQTPTAGQMIYIDYLG